MKLKATAAMMAAALFLAGCEKATETPAPAETAGGQQAEESGLDTQEKKLSYIFGQNIGAQFKADDVAIDVGVFADGVSDALEGEESRLSEEEVMTVLQSFQEEKMAEQQAKMDAMAEENRAEGETFLAENLAKEGVEVLESGLQYKVITEGEGPSPTPDSTVKVHYRGTLLDGTEFDSSYKRGEPATFGVTQVIPGWTEALTMMKEGARWELYIPPSLAYGTGGAGGMIGPEQTLIFEVELLDANVTDEDVEAEEAAPEETDAAEE